MSGYLICAALILFVRPAWGNTTLTLGGDPNQIYAVNHTTINVGPYPASIGGTAGLLLFCLDEGLTATFGGRYDGTLHTPASEIEEEAAFLAAWSLSKGAPNSSPISVSNVEGPISMAIWQVLGKLGGEAPDPKALPYIQTAQYAYSHGLIPSNFLNSVEILVPTSSNIQPFITAIRNDAMISDAISAAGVPEPRTAFSFLAGIALLALAVPRLLSRPDS